MMYLKQARVKTIKNNIQKGERVPLTKKDCEMGQWVDYELTQRGHPVDTNGTVDLPQYGIDNKTRKKGSKASWTVGSHTVDAIKKTPNWFETNYYKKSLNQNHIEWDPDHLEVSNQTIIDMDLPEIQEYLKTAYENLRSKVVNGDLRKNITSDCGWAILDGYNRPGSYRFRITNKAMEKIKSISRTRDTRKNLFIE